MSRVAVNPGYMSETIGIEVLDPETGAYTTLTVRHAEMMPTMGREVALADSTVPVVPVRWRTRYSRALATVDVREARLRARGRIYNITYIEDERNEHQILYIVSELTDIYE